MNASNYFRGAMVFIISLTVGAGSTPSPDVAAIDGDTIDGWGTVVDPAGDCVVEIVNGKLSIIVPGSIIPHDLSPELTSSTAPRVLQSVEGDFKIQVRVDGDFQPGALSTQVGRTGYTGAGLVVFADEKNFIRIERATLQRTGGQAEPYINFELRVNGNLERMGTTGDFNIEGDKPTWLRLERKGNEILGAMSQDAETWIYGESKELSAEAWSENSINAGIAAISTSISDFKPTYSDFSIEQ